MAGTRGGLPLEAGAQCARAVVALVADKITGDRADRAAQPLSGQGALRLADAQAVPVDQLMGAAGGTPPLALGQLATRRVQLAVGAGRHLDDHRGVHSGRHLAQSGRYGR